MGSLALAMDLAQVLKCESLEVSSQRCAYFDGAQTRDSCHLVMGEGECGIARLAFTPTIGVKRQVTRRVALLIIFCVEYPHPAAEKPDRLPATPDRPPLVR